uniref:C2H2-type domain-containing protein n=1 Tax=Arcella intermedia TaxID=1963864 RepID=A0A6B2L427_9EUKA
MGSNSSIARIQYQASPMIFEISAPSGVRSFCGVMEFIAPSGSVAVPGWLMEHLGLSPGQSVQIRKVTLPKGVYVQLQPHSGDVNKMPDLKATLEWVLRRFIALTVGDTIEVSHENVKMRFDVLKCSPDRAIAITDQDVSVDFVKPLDGSEVTMPTAPAEKVEEQKAPVETRSGNITGVVDNSDAPQCSHCLQRIPPAQFTMHELRCARINWRCPSCNMVVLKTDKDKHIDELHSIKPCEACLQPLEVREHAAHKKDDCPARTVSCQYCQLTMQYRKLFIHEQSCGAVTELCSKCRKRFPRSEQKSHEKSCNTEPTIPSVGKLKVTPPPPPPPKEDIFICEGCTQPFHSFDELQVHYLTSHYDEHLSDIATESNRFSVLQNEDDPLLVDQTDKPSQPENPSPIQKQ